MTIERALAASNCPTPAQHLNSVIGEISMERFRQKAGEGWTEEHDDEHEHGEMALAAACYATPIPIKGHVPTQIYGDENCGCREANCPHCMTFSQIVKRWRDIAAALLVAEIERLDRIALKREIK